MKGFESEFELLLEGLMDSLNAIEEGDNPEAALSNAKEYHNRLYILYEEMPCIDELEEQNTTLMQLLSENLTYEQKLDIRIKHNIEID